MAETKTGSNSGSKTIEQHAEDAKTPDWLFASTKAYHTWPVGKELSRAEYDAAVDKAANCKTASLKDEKGNDTSGLIRPSSSSLRPSGLLPDDDATK